MGRRWLRDMGEMIGFDTIAVGMVLLFGARKAIAFVRYDLGRGDRLRAAREARLAY